MQELNQAKIVELTVAETQQVEGGILPLLAIGAMALVDVAIWGYVARLAR